MSLVTVKSTHKTKKKIYIGLGAYYFIVFCEWIQPTLETNDRKSFRLHWIGPLCYLRVANDMNKKD